MRRVTEAEYLARLAASPTRLEFIDGEVIDIRAMAGGSFSHGVTPVNVATALAPTTGAQNCVTASSDVAVRVGERRECCFPDLTVVCGEPELDGAFLLNPTAVFEVLSIGTESIDRGPKFERYQLLPSIEEIVFIEQRRPRIERFRRQGAVWLYEWAEGLNSTADILGKPLRLTDVYQNVKFPPLDPLDRA